MIEINEDAWKQCCRVNFDDDCEDNCVMYKDCKEYKELIKLRPASEFALKEEAKS
jgi:hypothetical protein